MSPTFEHVDRSNGAGWYIDLAMGCFPFCPAGQSRWTLHHLRGERFVIRALELEKFKASEKGPASGLHR
jgi:hypothetical protein